MISNIHRVDGKFFDPHEIMETLIRFSQDKSLEDEYKVFLEELREAGMHKHPLLKQFFVES
jgi:hypothetical protein